MKKAERVRERRGEGGVKWLLGGKEISLKGE